MASTRSLAAERVRLLSEDDEPEAPGQSRDPEQLRAQAADVREQEAFLLEEIAEAKAALEDAVLTRTDAERGHAEETTRLQREARAAADRREGLAKLGGQVGAKASRIEAREAEVGRLRSTIEAAQARAAEAEHEFSRLESSVAQDEEGEEGLDTAYEEAAARLEAAEAELARWKEAEATAERARTTAAARVEALGLSLSRKDGAAALLAAADEGHRDPRLRRLARHRRARARERRGRRPRRRLPRPWPSVRSTPPRPPWTRCVTATTAAPAFSSRSPRRRVDPASWPALTGEARWVRDVVECPDSVRPAVEQVLERVALVPDGAAARTLVRSHPGVTAVTRGGDVYAPGAVRGGSTTAPSLLELQAALDDAQDAMARATREGEEARFRVSGADATRAELADAVEAALERLNESDARMAAIAEKLGSLGQTLRGRALRGRAHREGDRRRDRGPRGRPDRARRPPRAARGSERRGRLRRRALHRGARPSRGRRPRGPRGRDRAASGAAHPRGARACPQGPRRRPRARRPPRGGGASAPRREAGPPPARGRRRRGRAHGRGLGPRAARRVGRAGRPRPCRR